MTRLIVMRAGLAIAIALSLAASPGAARAAPPRVEVALSSTSSSCPGMMREPAKPASGGLQRGQRAAAPEDDDDTHPENAREPGAIDDGGSLLFAAAITVESSIAAARDAAEGEIGEVDLEVINGDIVFIVDVGDRDVHVDAESGAVLSVKRDD